MLYRSCLRSLSTIPSLLPKSSKAACVRGPFLNVSNIRHLSVPRRADVTDILLPSVHPDPRFLPTSKSRRFATECKSEPAEASISDIEKPNANQLKQLFVASAIPFVGFGFFDNFVMILAGDFIDGTLCVKFCLSTMAAAAVGNTISDVIGIYASGLIEQAADKVGIREPPLTSDQRLLPRTKVYQYSGQIIGIVLGCMLGACPLLFLDLKEAARLKRQKEMKAMLDEAMPDVQRIMKAQAVLLMSVDEEKEELSCLSSSDNLPDVQPWSIHNGIMGHVARTSRFVNTADVSESPMYHAPLHDNFQGYLRVKSLVCVPVLRAEKVVAVLTAMNKENGGAFSAKDEDNLSFIASHMSVRMETALDAEQSFKDVVLTCEKVMAKQESFEYGHTARQRRASLYLPALDGISRVLQAQATALMLLDEEHAELFTEAIVGDLPKHKNKLGEGIAGRCASQGRILNVLRDVNDDDMWFDKDRHNDYLGSGTMVWSELCVPMFNSARKCLGVVKIINKEGGGAFDEEDTAFATEVANNLAIMLEDDGGIKRVLVLARQQIQHKAATVGSRANEHTLLCYLEKGQNLPNNADVYGVGLDPYVTARIVHGDPSGTQDMAKYAMRDREKDRLEVVRRFGKSKTVMQCLNPVWEETIALTIPIELRGIPDKELYVQVMLWDYDALPFKSDDLIGQAVFNLAKMPVGKLKAAMPCHLQRIPGIEDYQLDRSMIWLSFSRGPKSSAQHLSPSLARADSGGVPAEDWAGDTYVPNVGQGAVDKFASSDDWLKVVESVREGLKNSCSVSIEEINRMQNDRDVGSIMCAIADPGQPDSPLVYVSKSFEDLTGYPRAYALGRNCRFLQPNNRNENDVANLADRERMKRFVQGLMPDDYVLWNLVLNETFDGKKFWNMLRMEYVYLGADRKPYIFAVQREFKNAPKSMKDVGAMRLKLAEHEEKGTVPLEVMAWAGLHNPGQECQTVTSSLRRRLSSTLRLG